MIPKQLNFSTIMLNDVNDDDEGDINKGIFCKMPDNLIRSQDLCFSFPPRNFVINLFCLVTLVFSVLPI